MNNVLVMVLSTFNKNANNEVVPSILKNDDGSLYQYYHQMEPVPYELKKNENLDTIIMLCSKETMLENEYVFDGETVSTSAKDYIIKKFPDINIIPVEIDLANESNGIIRTVSILREIYSSNDECNLYVDIHGGRRDYQTILQVVISILEKENIKPTKILTVEGSNREYSIKEAKESFDINYLYSGMNEFFNTGKADMLKKYLLNQPKNNQNERLTEIISTISDAILLCDMDSFDKGCRMMADYLEKRKDDGTLIDAFVEYFKADYGVLLSKDKGYVDVIDWCVKKEFVQQALTIVESKMPKVIINNNALKFNWHDELFYYDCESGEKNNIYLSTFIEEIKNDWEEPENYIFQKWAFENVVSKTEEKKEKYNYKYDNCIINDKYNGAIVEYTSTNKSVTKHLNLSEERNIKNYNELINDSEYKNGTIDLKWKKAADKLQLMIDIDDSIFEKKKFVFFSKLHMALKDQRNAANHGASRDEGRIDIISLKNALKLYTKLARELGFVSYPEIKIFDENVHITQLETRKIYECGIGEIIDISKSKKSYIIRGDIHEECFMEANVFKQNKAVREYIGRKYEIEYLSENLGKWKVRPVKNDKNRGCAYDFKIEN